MAVPFDPYYKWLGIPPDEQPPHHYRLLALRLFEPDADVIEAAAEQRMAHLRNYQAGPYAGLSQRLLNELAAARICLLNAEQRLAYDRALRSQLARHAPPALPVQPPTLPPRAALATPVLAEPTAIPLDFFADSGSPPGRTARRSERDRSLTALLMGISAIILAVVALIFFVRVVRSRQYVMVPAEEVEHEDNVASNAAASARTTAGKSQAESQEPPAFPQVIPHPVTLPDPPPRAPNPIADWMQKFREQARRNQQVEPKSPPATPAPAKATPTKPKPTAEKPAPQPKPSAATEEDGPTPEGQRHHTLAEWVAQSINARTLERSMAGGGGNGGTAFVEVPPAGAILTGFNLSVSETGNITSLQPIFIGVRGTRGGPGTRYGTLRGRQVSVTARRGYAVAAVHIQGAEAVDGFEVEFARITAIGLDRKDIYTSPWVGRRDSAPALAIGGDGLPVVGIYGRAGAAIYSLGLIQLPAE